MSESDTVDAFRYEIHSYGMGGYPSEDYFIIWIPSMNISIDEHGNVHKTNRPVDSRVAGAASDKYIHSCNLKETPFSDEELRRINDEANKSSYISIKLRRDKIDEIMALSAKLDELRVEQSKISEKIASLSKLLF